MPPGRPVEIVVTRLAGREVRPGGPAGPGGLAPPVRRRLPGRHRFYDGHVPRRTGPARSPAGDRHSGHPDRVTSLGGMVYLTLAAPARRQEALHAPLGRAAPEYVITRYRDPSSNLRTQLHRIIAKAGLKPWPKLFQNLRSTRETELAETWPMHVVCAWIGISEAVAQKHYLQVTDEHFEQAAGGGRNAPEKATQNQAQQAAAASCGEPLAVLCENCKPLKDNALRDSARMCLINDIC